MNRRTKQGYNLIIICLMVFLFNTVYYPIIFTQEQDTEKPLISENNQDIQVIVESPTNVLSGTREDIKLIMNKRHQGNIIIKGIILSYIDINSHIIFRSKTTYDFALQDHYEGTIHVRIPEIFQLDKVAETDIPLDCTLVILYEDDGIAECIYASLDMWVYDRFLENENKERVQNNEPIAIT